jgi:polysaccharide biosynthesis/export protein
VSRRTAFFVSSLLLTVAAALATAEAQTVPSTSDDSAAVAEQENLATYRINPLDRLLIVIYAGDKQTSEYTKYVQSDGTVYLPFLEQDVKIGGLMLLDAQRKLEELSRKYIKEPRVVITVVSSFSQNVSTYGRIANRNVELNTPMRVLQLIARVGGPTEGATEDSIRVISTDGAVRLFNYRKVNRDPSSPENFLLKPGDIVYVPGADDYSIMVFGEVKNPGVYRMKSGDRLLDALMRAGSWGGNAQISKLRILRTSGERKAETRRANLKRLFNSAETRENLVLQDGDIVFVPEKLTIVQPLTVIIGLVYTALMSYNIWWTTHN